MKVGDAEELVSQVREKRRSRRETLRYWKQRAEGRGTGDARIPDSDRGVKSKKSNVLKGI